MIEDAAESHGAEYKGRRCGSLGDAAGFSFYGNKIITTGEGGMITTNNREIAKLAWNLRDHAFSTERHFWHKFVGFNYRMTNLQAAVGLAQVEQMDHFVAARRPQAAEYNCRLWGIPGITTPPEAAWAKNVYWMYGILVDQAQYGMNRDQLRRVLADNGVETRTFFIPMHCQPVYWHDFKGQRYPVAERLCAATASICRRPHRWRWKKSSTSPKSSVRRARTCKCVRYCAEKRNENPPAVLTLPHGIGYAW